MISRFLLLSVVFHFSIIVSAKITHVQVNEIDISGNLKTKDFIILREVLLKKDSIYYFNSQDEFRYSIDQSKNRILNLNLFNEVTLFVDTVAYKEQLTINIRIHVIEKWYVWPLPFVEFSDRNFNIWSNLEFDPERTNYGLYIDHYNVFGRNHTMKTRLKTGYNNQVGVEYRIPFLGPRTQWGVNGEFQYNSQNEVWYQTRNDSLQFFKNGDNNLIQNTLAKIQFSKRLSPFINIFQGVSYQQTSLDTSVPNQDFFTNGGASQHHFASHFRLEHDTRNNIYFPLTGVFISPEISIHRFGSSDATYDFELQLKAQHFKQLYSKFYTAFSVHSRFSTQTSLGYLNSKQFGYNRIIRGFEHYVVDGFFGTNATAAVRYHLLNKSNLKLSFTPIDNYKVLPLNIYLEAFADGGYVEQQAILNDHSNSLPETIIYSGGLGLNVLFYNDRVLRLEYSMNSLKDDGIFVHFQKAI